tara:strand:- start:7145 stop:7417 length:273 start_codon:yes stop_codon:yes gene_type:complete
MNYNNVTLAAGVWTNLNTLGGITTGNAMFVKNLGIVRVRIMQSATQPTGVVGDVLTSLSLPYAHKDIAAGGDDVWVMATHACEIVYAEVV